MTAHGGYLCRVENFDSVDLASLAREALRLDGGADAGGLELSWIRKRKIARLSFDLQARGGAGPGWFESHHALAKLLSVHLGATVHAYLLDPAWGEQVAAYGAGRRVGGEQLRYADVDLALDELDDELFEELQSRWPLGHLAYVFGVSRAQLLSLGTTPPALVISLGAARFDAA